MKICPTCGTRFNRSSFICTTCSYQPKLVHRYQAFAPELAATGDSYDPHFYEQLFVLEDQNFWFRSRNRLIIWALNCYFPNIQNFLEIGCGTGYVLTGIERAFPDLDLSGSEMFVEGLQCATKRLARTKLFQMDALHIPFEDEFEAIGSFDVLEHIQDDTKVLAEIHRALVPGGGLILTVPQHPWLWSQADDAAHHVRRYRADELKSKVEHVGFKIVRMTSFVSLLLPLMFLSRLRQRQPNSNYNIFSELRISGTMNHILEMALNWERWLIELGISFPWGGSLLLVAQKK